MREIKFRAWNRYNKEMRFFDNYSVCHEYYSITWNDSNLDSDTWALASDDPLMQYTGLKDKNGKEIYEGDIVRQEFGEHVEVKWWEETGFYPFVYHGDQWTAAECEIIGNKHENPDLLKDPTNTN